MKSFLSCLIFTVSILVSSTTLAQIPNFGFENWTLVNNIEEADYWKSPNSYCTGSFNPVTKSTDHYPLNEGNYSIKLENGGWNYWDRCTHAIVGTPDTLRYKPSFAISGHPTSLQGYYKYVNNGLDTLSIFLWLYKNGSVVSFATFLEWDTVPNWTAFSIPIPAYADADSATIFMAAYNSGIDMWNQPDGINNPKQPFTYPYYPDDNSIAYFDNLSFDNLITSVDAVRNSSSLNLYPNPVNSHLTIELKEPALNSIYIYDLLGSLLFTDQISNGKNMLDVGTLSSGTYFLNIVDKEGKISRTKFEVVKN